MMKIVLLAGGDSTEREVSLMSADEMKKALHPDKYQVTLIDIQPGDHRQWIQALLTASPDMVLLALHGGTGENGAIQGLLNCMGIPYAGSGILGSALCMDKYMSKFIMRARHIPVPDDVLLPRGAAAADYTSAITRLGFPLVVKPNQGGSSVGVSVVQNTDELYRAVEAASVYEDDVLIEQFIPGHEITCAVISTPDEPEALPVLDIKAAEGFYDYEAKYFKDNTYIAQSTLPALIREMITEIARQAYTALHCDGYARVDMMVYEEQIYVLEVNTLPGMTSHSLFPKAASLAGLSYSAMLDRLIEEAILER